MNSKNLLKFILYSIALILLSSGLTYWMSSHQVIAPASIEVSNPENNCDIRTWYNFQVIAIDQMNEYWIHQGLDLETRAQKAFLLRHNARKYARFMMKDKTEVASLEQRDFNKYGNPDGPSFEYLLEKNQTKGLTISESYEQIIKSASQTNRRQNAVCHTH
ncbi:hypothetical protein [Aureispira anguillae]|uniref:Uncharacterized protein n=1 Tax=Aureispira anguillae TaxID=2864201 RepID=A0A915YII5_9BACT|nr:hypothetical protein [Aureispira anguillae]BDS13639.1 hypothetical protein AsAng_0043780 [Aureispira anguillae]